MSQIARYHKSELSDEVIAGFFVRLIASGRERVSFYSCPRKSIPEFVDLVRTPENSWWLLTFENEMAGMVYLTDIMGKSAMIHFCCLPMPKLRHESGIAAPVAVIRKALAGILHDTYPDGHYMMDSVVGKLAAWNKAALKLPPQCGGVTLGEIPSVCFSHDSGGNAPGSISYYTRDTVPFAWRGL